MKLELVLTHKFSKPEAFQPVFFLSILSYCGELLYHGLLYVTKKVNITKPIFIQKIGKRCLSQ